MSRKQTLALQNLTWNNTQEKLSSPKTTHTIKTNILRNFKTNQLLLTIIQQNTLVTINKLKQTKQQKLKDKIYTLKQQMSKNARNHNNLNKARA